MMIVRVLGLCAIIAVSSAAALAQQPAPQNFYDCANYAPMSTEYNRCMSAVEQANRRRSDEMLNDAYRRLDQLNQQPLAQPRLVQPSFRIGFYDQNRLYINGTYIDLRSRGACGQLRSIVQTGAHRRAQNQPLPNGYHPMNPEDIEEMVNHGACRGRS